MTKCINNDRFDVMSEKIARDLAETLAKFPNVMLSNLEIDETLKGFYKVSFLVKINNEVKND